MLFVVFLKLNKLKSFTFGGLKLPIFNCGWATDLVKTSLLLTTESISYQQKGIQGSLQVSTNLFWRNYSSVFKRTQKMHLICKDTKQLIFQILERGTMGRTEAFHDPRPRTCGIENVKCVIHEKKKWKRTSDVFISFP